MVFILLINHYYLKDMHQIYKNFHRKFAKSKCNSLGAIFLSFINVFVFRMSTK